MSTTGSISHKGMSTVLGTIIFVGIVFSAFIPMLLVMKQADTLHDSIKHQVETLDEEKSLENVCLYVCPESASSQTVNVKLRNNGEILTHIVTLWINDVPQSEDITIPSLGDYEINIGLNPVSGNEYDIRVTTDRGNVFVSETGVLKYGTDGWEMETFSIVIFYSGWGWWLHVQIWAGTYTSEPDPGIDPPFYDEQLNTGWWGQDGYEIMVPQSGDYWVKITSTGFGGGVIYNQKVTIPFPNGEPRVWILI